MLQKELVGEFNFQIRLNKPCNSRVHEYNKCIFRSKEFRLMSNLYCKTKSGKVFKVWTDNTDEETMNVYPTDEQFDAESTNTKIVKYSEIEKVDSNLAILQN